MIRLPGRSCTQVINQQLQKLHRSRDLKQQMSGGDFSWIVIGGRFLSHNR